jgi:PPOX class probable F420-dependent enzyme
MTDLDHVARLAAADHHLAVIAVGRPDGSVHASVVSAGVMDDPVDGTPGVAAVVGGDSRKLGLLRASGRATLVFKDGWDWAAVSGPARLVGPDDGLDLGIDVPELLRSVFRAAGGSHEDWAEYDRVMAAERRCAVFVRADAVSSNAGRG